MQRRDACHVITSTFLPRVAAICKAPQFNPFLPLLFHRLPKFLSHSRSLSSFSQPPPMASSCTTTFPVPDQEDLVLQTIDENTNNPPPPPHPTFEIGQTSQAIVVDSAGATAVASGDSTSRAAATDTNNNNGGGDQVCAGRSNRGVTWGSCLSQGIQKKMEDFVAVVPAFLRLKCDQVGGCTAPECKYAAEEQPVHYFGLFDGHGGAQVSHYCSERLHKLVAEEWHNVDGENEWSKRWEIALTRAFNRADDAFKNRALAPYTVGSTAVVVIISSCQIIVANCGDSRAVLCHGSQAIPLSSDHKLNRADEEERITSSGGKILYVGCLRVQGVLNITRSIGDQDLKRWVISDPEVTFFRRSEEDDFLILASDGLWDVKSNEEVMAFGRRMLREQRRRLAIGTNGLLSPAQHVAEEVVSGALYTSSDNVSVILVNLKRLRKKPQQMAVDA